MQYQNIGIVAGEPSGDILGAGLITQLRQACPELSITGVGGPQMIEAGCRSLYNMESLSVMGLVEPLLHLPELMKIRRGLTQHFLNNRPDVFIGIDSPDFNLGLEHKLKQAGIPVVHYVSPSVWAWRKKRIFKIAKAVDLMLTLFPFEANFYEQHHVPVKFVGHPLADAIPLQSDKKAARQRLNLDPDKKYIAILPGSRRNEIRYLGETFIGAAYRCWKLKPDVQFITCAPNEKRFHEFQQLWNRFIPQIPVRFFSGRSRDVMEASDVVLVTSGTATLETMLYKRPMVIAYRMSPITFQIARTLVKIPFIGLPNLLANEKLVPEFIQNEATPDRLALAIIHFLDHPEAVQELQKKFMEIHLALRRNANVEAAKAILKLKR